MKVEFIEGTNRTPLLKVEAESIYENMFIRELQKRKVVLNGSGLHCDTMLENVSFRFVLKEESK